MGGTTYCAPTAADAVLEALEGAGLDHMNAFIKQLRAKADALEADRELRQVDYAGLLAFVEELKKQVKDTLDAAGDEQQVRDRTAHLRKLIAPWPPQRSYRLN